MARQDLMLAYREARQDLAGKALDLLDTPGMDALLRKLTSGAVVIDDLDEDLRIALGKLGKIQKEHVQVLRRLS